MVLAMRRHNLLMDLMEMAQAQEMALREQQREEQQMEMVLARSLEETTGSGSGGGGSLGRASQFGQQSSTGGERRAGPSLALIEEVLPAMPFSAARGFLLSAEDGSSHECAVCIAELKGDETVRVLPCVHVFHQACVDTWFSRSQSCPTCKQDVALG